MLTWSGLQTKYTDNTNDVTTANLTFGKTAMNRAYHNLVRAGNFDFPEYRTALTSVDGTYVYTLPPQFSKMKEVVYETSGDYKVLTEVESLKDWDNLYTTAEGEPQFYMIRKAAVGFNTWELWLYPTPGTSSVTIRITYLRLVPDLANDDYTTGTITATNADATITGSGTTFTAAMVGRSIKLPDGLWYDIASYTSATSIETTYNFQGTTASGQSYTIGEIPIIPEPHHDAIYAYAVSEFYRKKRQFEDSNYWMNIYAMGKKELEDDRKNRTANRNIYGKRLYHRSINRYPSAY